MVPAQINSEDQLIAALAAQSEGAVEAVVDRYGGRIYVLALRLMGNEADARDVMPDALLTACQKIRSLERPAALASGIGRAPATALMRLGKLKLPNRRGRQRAGLGVALGFLPDEHGDSGGRAVHDLLHRLRLVPQRAPKGVAIWPPA